MPKNIVICCDGTANEFAKDRTNVIKLYSVLEHDPTIPPGSLIHNSAYQRGAEYAKLLPADGIQV